MYKKAPSFQNESPPQQTLYTKLWDQLTTFLFSSCAIPPGTQASSGWSNASSGDMWYNVGLVLVDDSTPVSHMVSLSRTCQSLIKSPVGTVLSQRFCIRFFTDSSPTEL
eukprot:TRINITY_DN11601_c0_g1_i3.p2 TRINITY_DN11601_c0_g1~~TRINITY_DN11601_c0_g1_i3.p2  ORF type:complete len:109 (+),score=22.28 TRINITY_DN11601_c0_g1_i3:122-448(+)